MSVAPDRFRNLENLFLEALVHGKEGRSRFLDEACSGDDELRARVEALLAADEAGDSFLRVTEAAPGPRPSGKGPSSPPGEGAFLGRRIGPFRCLRVIGVGGMGTVYEAEQETPGRRVALKVLSAAIPSPQALRRFRFESEILARLRHPGIAHLYEAGVFLHEGRSIPYFAMEYLEGALDLVEFADRGGLDVPQRVELVARVCDAVHHGHQKGVVHRDLKPGNILVEPGGRPRVIDFGVARSTNADVVNTTMHTDAGVLVGTLAYMSPEQCEGDPREIDTRSDVYSLGVVLYELLCECLPYDVDMTAFGPLLEAIRAAPPRRPSNVKRTLRGDLETVVLKALEKDRELRYASAADLARDLRAWASGEPIRARPPSTVYYIRKLVHRHKALSALVVLLLLVLVAFSFSTALQLRRIARERDTATEISGFLQDIFAGADPELMGYDVSGAQMLDRAVQNLEDQLGDNPEVKAALYDTVARAYLNLGRFEEAEAQWRQVIELRGVLADEQDGEVSRCLRYIAIAQHRAGEDERGAETIAEALGRDEEFWGSESLEVSLSLEVLGAIQMGLGRLGEAAESLTRALRMRREQLGGTDDWQVAEILNSIGVLYDRGEQIAAAEAAYREALEIGARLWPVGHVKLARFHNNLGSALMKKGDVAAAAEHWSHAREGFTRFLGEDHPAVGTCLSNLALVHQMQGDLEGAERVLRQSIDLFRKRPGAERMGAAGPLLKLSGLYLRRGDRAGATDLAREALELHRRFLPPGHPKISFVRTQLAYMLLSVGRLEEAEREVREVLAGQREASSGRGQRSGDAVLLLGKIELEAGKASRALEHLEEGLAVRRKTYGPEHWKTAIAQCWRGECLIALGRLGAAESDLKVSLAILEKTLPTGDSRIAEAERALAEARRARAEPDGSSAPPGDEP